MRLVQGARDLGYNSTLEKQSWKAPKKSRVGSDLTEQCTIPERLKRKSSYGLLPAVSNTRTRGHEFQPPRKWSKEGTKVEIKCG